MSKTKRITLGIVGVLLIISLVVGISYAAWRITLTQTNENTIATSCFNISFLEENNILLENTYPIFDEDGKKLVPYTFTIKNNCEAYATYQVNLEIVNTSTLNSQNIKVMINEEEPIILNELTEGQVTLDDAKEAFILDTDALDKNEEKTYTLRVWIDENVTTETEGVQNSTWISKVTITASYIDHLPTFCELNPNTGACEILVKGETNELAYDGTTDNNLRYIGADPNNYVSFNNELWRIIGVFNNIDNGTGTKETRLKIIRNESIGEYNWDNKASGTGSSISHFGSSDWSDSALQIILNEGAYYNRTTGECPYGSNGATKTCDFSETGLSEEAKNMIESALWNLGGSSTWNDVTASMFYERERGTTVYGGHTTEWVGKVALMYPSDYGYATNGGSTIDRETCLNTALYNWGSISDCKNNSWLYDSSNNQWTLTSYSDRNVFFVYTGGTVLYQTAANYLNTSRGTVLPALYLKANVKIIEGTGTSSNPYQLSL